MKLTSFDGYLWEAAGYHAGLDDADNRSSFDMGLLVQPRQDGDPLLLGGAGNPRVINAIFTYDGTGGLTYENAWSTLLGKLRPRSVQAGGRTLTATRNDAVTVEAQATVSLPGGWDQDFDVSTLLVTFTVLDLSWKATTETSVGPGAFSGAGTQSFTVGGYDDVKPSLRLGWVTQRASAASNCGWTKRKQITITNNGTQSVRNLAWQIGPLDSAALVTAGKMQSDCDDLVVFDSLGRRLRHSVFGTNQKATFVWFVIDELVAGGSRVYDVCYGNSAANAASNTGFPLSYPGSPSVDVTGQDGTASASAAGTLVLTAGASLDPNCRVGSTAIICADTDGLAGGMMRRVASHTTAATAVLTMTRNWNVTPDATCRYVIVGSGFMGDGGAVTSATATTLTDSSQTWNTNEWIGATAQVVTLGTGMGTVTKSGTVTGNTGTALTVGSWTGGTPSAAEVYRVFRGNGIWHWRVDQTRRVNYPNSYHRGRWRCNPVLVQPSNIYDAAAGSPQAWTWATYNPYAAQNDYSQERYSFLDTGGAEYDAFTILDANLARKDGARLTNEGFANGVSLTSPLPFLGVRQNFQIKNPSAMAMAKFCCRERGGEDWSSYLNYSTAQASLTAVATAYYDLSVDFGSPLHLGAFLTSVDGADIPKTTTTTATLRDYTVLEARVDTRTITTTDFDTATESEVYDYTLTVREGASSQAVGDSLVIVGGSGSGEERHVFLRAREQLWVGPLDDLGIPYAARIVDSIFTSNTGTDTFTDANGTTVQAHVPSGGGTWTEHTSSGAGDATIDTNRAHNANTATTHMLYHSATPASADYDVEADVVMRTDNNLSKAGPAGRISTSAETFYVARYNTTGNVWQLFKAVAGVYTQVGSDYAQTLTVDTTYVCTLVMRGNWLRVLVDGVTVINDTDSSVTAVGRAGLYMTEAASSTTGVHLDNWSFADANTGSLPTFVRDVPGQVQVLVVEHDYEGTATRVETSEVLPLSPGAVTLQISDDVGSIGEIVSEVVYRQAYL